MAATITSSGTWSLLQNTNPTSQAPGAIGNESVAVHRDTVEQRADSLAFNYRANFTADVDGQQEVTQFVALFAANYSIPGVAAVARIRDILTGQRQGEPVETQRVYQP